MFSKSFFSPKKFNKLNIKTIHKSPKQNLALKKFNRPVENTINWQTVIVSVSISIAIYSILKSLSDKKNINQLQDFQNLNNNDFSINTQLSILNNLNLLAADEEIESMKPRESTTDLYSFGGNEEIVNNISDVVKYLQDPESYEKLNLKVPKGIILSGPPGVGKSTFADMVAGHAGVRIIRVSASDFHAPLVGETEARLRKIFAEAKKAAPCVLCFDEFDSLASKRVNVKGSTDNYMNGVVNELLNLLAENNPGVIVFATTNNYKALDPAIVRPGRFDRHIQIPLPDANSRVDILKIYTKTKKLASDVSLESLSLICGGYSGAKIEAWVNEAAIIANREGSNVINQNHFDEALIVAEVGIKKEVINPIEQQRTAIHEAGHALVGQLFNQKVYKVSTKQYGNARGYTFIISDDSSINQTKEEMLNTICRILAGRAAEQVANSIQSGSSSDLQRAKELAKEFVILEGMGSTLTGLNAEYQIEKILQEQMKRAVSLIEENYTTWDRLRNALIEYDELNQNEFLKIIDGKKIERNSENTNKGWWWSETKPTPTPQKKSALPPKKAYGTSSTNGYFSKNPKVDVNQIPINIDQIAKALNVPAEKIRYIKREPEGGFKIQFKPSFDQYDEYRRIGNFLRLNDIENWAFSIENSVEIKPEGYEDFVAFVEKNGNGTSPSKRDIFGFWKYIGLNSDEICTHSDNRCRS